jgi:hypothetical protein
VAYPPIVTYDERQQTLTTNLGNICSTVSGVTTCTSPESIQLILSTTSAHAFNFIVPGLSGGNHTVTFKIAVATDATATSLLAGAEAQAASRGTRASLHDQFRHETAYSFTSSCAA